MPQRNPPYAPVEQYSPLRVNAFPSWVNTTISAVGATGLQTVTPASMTGIVVGTILHIGAGGTTAEDVVVTAVTSTTFTAVFAFTHSANDTCTTPAYMQYLPVGSGVLTSSATQITAGSGVVVTPASMAGIYNGCKLNVANGTGTGETVTAYNCTTTTFTADFAYNHSGAYTIISVVGTFLGPIVVNAPGTTATLTLYNGHPSVSPLPAKSGAIGAMEPSATAQNYLHGGACDYGLWYQYSGSVAGDLTIWYTDMQPA